MIFTILLYVHVVLGSLGLLSDTLNIMRKKSATAHQNVGKMFYYSIMISSFSAIALSILNWNHFVFMVGIFTII